MNNLTTSSLRYVGFWPRLAAFLLDILIFLPWGVIVYFGEQYYRLFDLYLFIPTIFVELLYYVYLVHRFGGTPGKLIMGIRIRKLNGERVDYYQAILRYLPQFIFILLTSIAGVIAILNISDVEYYALAFMERAERLDQLTPFWNKIVQISLGVWMAVGLIVLLTNKKRRALHDFIAGTVVVYASSQ